MLSFTLRPPSDAWLQELDNVARARFGHLASDVRSLAEAVSALSQAYTRRAGAIDERTRRDDDLRARLCFFLPRDLGKVQLPLLELASVQALPQRSTLRVLDVGAGMGATSLGIAQLAAAERFAEALDVTAVDTDAAALELFRNVAEHAALLPAVPVSVTCQVADFRRLPRVLLARKYDLIVVGLALNELERAPSSEPTARSAQLLVELASALSPDGALIVLEPALRDTSRPLQALRDQLAARRASPFVFAPCVRSGACPMLAHPRDWCHERVQMALPPRLVEVAGFAGLRDHDLTFSYLTLHAANRTLSERANTLPVYRVVSGALRSKGKTEWTACGEGGLTRLMRLDRDRHIEEVDLEAAGRGTLLSLEGAPHADRIKLDAAVRVTRLQGVRA